MKQMKPTAAIFDSGGVLHQPVPVTEHVAKSLGTDKDTVRAIWKAHMGKLSLGQINEATFWKLANKDFGVRLPGPDERLLSRDFVPPLAAPTPTVFAIVNQLRTLGLKLAVCSNTIAPHGEALRQNGVYSGFDEVILSYEVGLQKPDPKIYQLTLDRLGVKAAQAIFIDDLAENIAATSRLGMHGLLFTDVARLESDLRALLADY